MKPITSDELKFIPVGTILELVWEDSDKEEEKSRGLVVITQNNKQTITLDYPEAKNPEEAMQFFIEEDLLEDGTHSNDTWVWMETEIEFKLYHKQNP